MTENGRSQSGYPDLVARWKEATADEVMADAMRESKTAGDTLASYLIFAFVLYDLRSFGFGGNVVAGVAVFALVFLGGNFLKAYLGGGSRRQATAAGAASRTMLTEEAVQIIGWGTTFAMVLLVQVRDLSVGFPRR